MEKVNNNLKSLKDTQFLLENNSKIDSNIKTALLECGYVLSQNNYSLTDFNILCSNITVKHKTLKHKIFDLVDYILYVDCHKINDELDLVHYIFLEVAFPNLKVENQAILTGYKQILANNLIGNFSDKLINPDEFNIVDIMAKTIGLEPFELMIEHQTIRPIIQSLSQLGVKNEQIIEILKLTEENFYEKNTPSNRYSKVMQQLSDIFCSHGVLHSNIQSTPDLIETSLHSNIIFEENKDNYLDLNNNRLNLNQIDDLDATNFFKL